MTQWMATIGELDLAFECDAPAFIDAEQLTFDWLHSIGGEPTFGDMWSTTTDIERIELSVTIPRSIRTLRPWPWPLSLFKRGRVKTITIKLHTTLRLSVVHDEMDSVQRLEFCKSVGLI